MNTWYYFDWAALIIGAALIFSGIRAIQRCRVAVPEVYEGKRAVGLGRLWIALGVLFIMAVVFDITLFKDLFRLFLGAAN